MRHIGCLIRIWCRAEICLLRTRREATFQRASLTSIVDGALPNLGARQGYHCSGSCRLPLPYHRHCTAHRLIIVFIRSSIELKICFHFAPVQSIIRIYASPRQVVLIETDGHNFQDICQAYEQISMQVLIQGLTRHNSNPPDDLLPQPGKPLTYRWG